MSKWAWGIVGTGVGAMGGAAAVVALELGAAAIVGLTLFFATPSAPVDVADGPVRSAAVKKAPKSKGYGQIQVTTMAAVTMQVDGQHVVFGPSGFLADVEPGQHRVELFDVLGRKKVDEVVTVDKGRRYAFRWRSKSFENMGVHGLIGSDGVEGEPVAAAVPATSGSVEVRGAMPSARVKVHDPDLGVDIEMDVGAAQIEIEDDSRFETVNVGGLEIEMPKALRRKGRGRR
jgi:hypothetical protein